MILPQTEPLSKFHRFPLTWTLLALNILIYFLFFAGQTDGFRNQKILETESTIITGKLYHQYLQHLSQSESPSRAPWIYKLSVNSNDQMEMMGAYALRDGDFLKQAETFPYTGDQVAIARWRNQIAAFLKFYDEDTMYNFGLNKADASSVTWITYQFSHASMTHLFSNMLFLIVIGTAVEAMAGSFALLAIYLFGGIAGGAAFLFYNGPGVIPMVGASASISALLAFYVLAESRRRIRFVYFISPFPKHNGYIYLPTLLIIPLFLLVDFTSLIANPEGIGNGVAYAAHAGGTIFGVLSGALARWVLHVKRPLVFVDPVPVAPTEERDDDDEDIW